jgi:hypothetical protein
VGPADASSLSFGPGQTVAHLVTGLDGWLPGRIRALRTVVDGPAELPEPSMCRPQATTVNALLVAYE